MCLPNSDLSPTLNNVLQVRHLKYNLLSVQKLCQDSNCEVGFDSSSGHIKDKAIGTALLEGSSDSGIYLLPISRIHAAPLIVHVSGNVYHRCHGHRGSRILYIVRHKNFISPVSKFTNLVSWAKLTD